MKNLSFPNRKMLLGMLFLLSFGFMSAQRSSTQVTPDQLETKLAQMYDQMAQGSLDKFDVKIAEIFTASLMKAADGNITTAQALEHAAKMAEQTYPNQGQKIQAIKNEYANWLH